MCVLKINTNRPLRQTSYSSHFLNAKNRQPNPPQPYPDILSTNTRFKPDGEHPSHSYQFLKHTTDTPQSILDGGRTTQQYSHGAPRWLFCHATPATVVVICASSSRPHRVAAAPADACSGALRKTYEANQLTIRFRNEKQISLGYDMIHHERTPKKKNATYPSQTKSCSVK